MAIFGENNSSSIAIANEVKWVLDQLNGIVFMYDESGKITYCTQRGAEVFGLTIDEMIGKRIADLVQKTRALRCRKR